MQCAPVSQVQNGRHTPSLEPCKPVQNVFIESFNGKFRDECLSQHWFSGLQDARETIEDLRLGAGHPQYAKKLLPSATRASGTVRATGSKAVQ
jgi:hypothetical protein